MTQHWFFKQKRIVGLAGIFILLGILTAVLFVYFQTPAIKDSVSYNESGTLDYQICLKDNDFIRENCLNGDRSFVTALINTMTVNLDYYISSSQNLQYRYTYDVVAHVRSTPKEDDQNAVYDETYPITQNEGTINSGILSLDLEIPIDYNAYNTMLTEFKKNYVLALDSTLSIAVTLHVEGWSDTMRETLTKDYTMTLSMPLSESTTKVTLTDANIADEGTLVAYQENGIYAWRTLILSGLLIMDVILGIALIVLIYQTRPREKDYRKIVKRILKNYDQAIVKTLSLPNLRNYRVIDVETFEDMLDARDNLQKPILFYEDKEQDCDVFVIINDQEAYCYRIGAKEGMSSRAR